MSKLHIPLSYIFNMIHYLYVDNIQPNIEDIK